MKNDIEALRGFAENLHGDGNIKLTDYQLFKKFLFYGLVDKDGYKTEIMTGSKDRIADAQRRLYWAWLTDMSKTKVEAVSGRTKEEYHWEMKERFLIPIFVRDDSEFAEMYSLYSRLTIGVSLWEKQAIKGKFLGDLSITDACKEQATEYLRDIESFCWTNGIELRTNRHLYEMAGMR